MPATTTTGRAPPPVSRTNPARPTWSASIGRHRPIEQVTRVDDEVDLLGVGDRGDFFDRRPGLLDPVVAAEALADVPVGGVEDSH